MKKLEYYLKKAKKEKWAAGQFNFCTVEQLRGICRAGADLKAPLILGTSESECKYLGIDEIISLVKIFRKKYRVEVFLNLDHGKDIDFLQSAAMAGYSAIHFDGSGLSLGENIKITGKLVKFAHKKGVLVEGELGHIGGESAVHKEFIRLSESDLTSPEEVREFVEKTKIDSLAVSFGNLHGIYTGEPDLRFDILEKAAGKTDAFLVMHGGSGVDEDDIGRAINIGVVKININTEIRAVWREALLSKLNGGEIKPYRALLRVEDDIKKKVEEKIRIFGSENKI